jgi:hypothetical protein
MIVRRPSGFVEPCLPSKAARPPSGPLWVDGIKHDGYRLMKRLCLETARLRQWPGAAGPVMTIAHEAADIREAYRKGKLRD